MELSRFFAERANRKMKRLWNDGTINEQTFDS